MKALRTVLFWLHLAAGVAAGLVILVMSATGAVLAFKPQILNRSTARCGSSSPRARRGSRRRRSSRLRRPSRPDVQPATLVFDRDPSASVAVGFGRDGTLYVNPYTGAVLGAGSAGAQQFFRTTEDLASLAEPRRREPRHGPFADRRVQPGVSRARRLGTVSLVAAQMAAAAPERDPVLQAHGHRARARFQLAQRHRLLVRAGPHRPDRDGRRDVVPVGEPARCIRWQAVRCRRHAAPGRRTAGRERGVDRAAQDATGAAR